jgi:hypothetical protein
MSQSLQTELNGKTNMPEVVDKAKKSIKSFEEQVGDIRKKFGESFKDVFLSFLGPMALLTAAIGLVTKLVADYQAKQEAANKAAIDGTNELMSAEDRYWANKQNKLEQDQKKKEENQVQVEKRTAEFLMKDQRGWGLLSEQQKAQVRVGGTTALGADKGLQERVQKILAEDMKKDPNNMIGKEYKAPEGFSNVVGVGANPVLEAMTAQLEEQRMQTQLLQVIASSTPTPSADFTKEKSNGFTAPANYMPMGH